MQNNPCLVILIISLALSIQAINLAAAGVGISLFKAIDRQYPPAVGLPSNMQQNIGYIAFVIAGSVISIVLYAYLLCIKVRQKHNKSKSVIIALFLAFGFQLAVATVLAVQVHNTEGQYNFDQAQLALLESMNVAGPTVNDYRLEKTHRNLCYAALVLDYIFGVAGIFFLFLKEVGTLSTDVGESPSNINSPNIMAGDFNPSCQLSEAKV